MGGITLKYVPRSIGSVSTSLWDVPHLDSTSTSTILIKSFWMTYVGELQLERHRGCLIGMHFIQQLPAESRFLGRIFFGRFFLFQCMTCHNKTSVSGAQQKPPENIRP